MTNQSSEYRVRLATVAVLFALAASFGEPRAALAGQPTPIPAARFRKGLPVVPKVIDRWSLPDLAISFSPGTRYSAAAFLIQNIGDSPSPTVIVRYRRQSGHFKDETYWPLGPGKTISTSGLGGSDLLLMPGSGPIVQAIVDPEGKVKEKSESNNTCSTTMKKRQTR